MQEWEDTLENKIEKVKPLLEMFHKDLGGFKSWPEMERLYKYHYEKQWKICELVRNFRIKSLKTCGEILFRKSDIDEIEYLARKHTHNLEELCAKDEYVFKCLNADIVCGVTLHAKFSAEMDYMSKNKAVRH